VKQTLVVIGGGISGLCLAYELVERSQRLPFPVEILCLEATDRPGGNIRSERRDGFLCEWGPNGFLDSAPATLTLARRLGLESRLVRASAAAAERYIFRRGRLRRLPHGAASFLTSDVLSFGGKLRVLGEPFARRGRDEDESVHAFAARRIGREAADVLVDGMVCGVYAGDVHALSLRACFPRMHEMESEHGSLVRAMLARRTRRGGGPAGPGGTLTSFAGGMQEAIDALVRELGQRVVLRRPVRAVSDMGRRGFRVHLAEGSPLDVASVILACPSRHAARIVADTDPPLAEALDEIPPAPLAVVHFGYVEDALGELPDGFGFLVPRTQGLRILGTLWSSSIFPGRAPAARRLFTTMIGGARDAQAIELDDEELIRIAREDLRRAMGVSVDPYFKLVLRHRLGIPQYTIGHPRRVARIEERLTYHPGLWVCGSSYRGVSVNLCVEEAQSVAEAALEHVTRRVEARSRESG
jgi:oxygen-dependent protoporphyrinogen oxidase